MSHARLVVLALLTEKSRHGYELELEIRRRNIRLWARVGTSTIYKLLNDLKKEDWILGRPGTPKRGAGREVFEITASGREGLRRLVLDSLSSRQSPYSDRLVGLVFSAAIQRGDAEEALQASHESVGAALSGLVAAEEGEMGPAKKIILDFYKEVMEAERRAIKAALAMVRDRAPASRSKNKLK